MATTRSVHIWDHPESRIRFLETVLEGKDWHAIVHGDPAITKEKAVHDLDRVGEELRQRGYSVKLEFDERAQPQLCVHHLGDETGLLAGFQDLGLVQGARRSLSKLSQPFGQAIHHTRDFLLQVTENPAQALGGLYLVSDLFQIFSEAHSDSKAAKAQGNKTSVWREAAKHYSHLFQGKDWEKSLMSFAGIMTTLNSLILIAYAKDPEEVQLEALNKQMHRAVAAGIDPLRPEVWKQRKEADHLLSGMTSLLKSHPIEAASLSQIIGQVGQFASGGIRASQGKKISNATLTSEGRFNMARAATSALSWCIFMLPNQKVGEKEPNLFSPTRWIQEFKDNPQRASALISASASIFGGMAALRGKKTLQMTSELSYLLGDATMFFVNTSHYGATGAAQQEALGKAAATFLHQSPMVFGREEEQHFIGSLSRYLAVRAVEANLVKHPLPGNARDREQAKAEAVETMSANLALIVFKEMSAKSKKTERVAHQVAQVLSLLPSEQQHAARDALAASIVTFTGVYLKEQELCDLIQAEEKRLSSATKERPVSKPGMQALSPALCELVYTLPGLGSAENALKLYDAISPYVRTGSQDVRLLNHALTHQASRDTGIPERAAQVALARA